MGLWLKGGGNGDGAGAGAEALSTGLRLRPGAQERLERSRDRG